MPHLRTFIVLLVLAALKVGEAEDVSPANALIPEHIHATVLKLNDADFREREAAAEQLFSLGMNAIEPLTEAAASRLPEVSIRAFDILQRLYRGNDEPTIEAVEQAYAQLKFSNNLAIAARAERAFDCGAEIRQDRAVVQFVRLGGIIRFDERKFDQHALGRPRIEYIMVGRDWTGGDTGFRLLERIEDVRVSLNNLYIIRGVEVSRETIQDLRFSLPLLQIQLRGPARLGVRSNSSSNDEGCVINSVDPGSAAELAGLKTSDVITRIDGQSVDDFQGLIEIIGTKEPGDRIPIVFRRGTEIQEVVAELSSWSNSSVPVPVKPKP